MQHTSPYKKYGSFICLFEDFKLPLTAEKKIKTYDYSAPKRQMTPRRQRPYRPGQPAAPADIQTTNDQIR